MIFALFLLLGGSALELIETSPTGSGLDDPTVAEAATMLPAVFNSAHNSIDIAQFYLLYYPPASRGRDLYPLYDAIIAAAQRGVRVRIMVDSVTLEQNPTATYCRMPEILRDIPGIEVRAADLRPYSRHPDCLMHAKYIIVDNRISVIGSHNWSSAAFNDNCELSLVVRDSTLSRSLSTVFETDWRLAGNSVPQPSLSAVASPDYHSQLVLTTPARLSRKVGLTTIEALTELCCSAESLLEIATNSISDRIDFGASPRFGLIESLLLAAVGRRVKVRLLVDRWAAEHDRELLERLAAIPGVSVRVIDIAAAGPNPAAGTMHAKVVIADRARALIGSATFSQRQLLECRNVGVLARDQTAVVSLTRFFERYWTCHWTRPLASAAGR